MYKKFFTLTQQHIDLLSKANIQWEETEFGAPCVDPKRPYGGSDSQILKDICKALHEDPDSISVEQEKFYLKIHGETEVALQIILSTKLFVPGFYSADEYSNNWELLHSDRTLGISKARIAMSLDEATDFLSQQESPEAESLVSYLAEAKILLDTLS